MFQSTIIGNLGKDAEIKQSNSGKEYLSFSVAVNTGWGDNKKTQWINVKKYGNVGGLAKLLTRGSKVAVVGSLDVSVWQEKPQCWLTANEVDLISSPPKVEGGNFDDVKGPGDAPPFALPESPF